MNKEKEVMDNFLSGPDDFLEELNVVKKDETKKIAPFVKKALVSDALQSGIVSVQEESEDDILHTNQKPKLLTKGGISSDFLDVVKKIHYQMSQLPCLNYSDVYREFSELTVKNISTPTLADINSQLEKVQSSKDRITELDIYITQCFLMKERMLDLLRDSWQKFSSEGSVDKRKADAAYLLVNFELDFAKLEGLHKACKYIMLNLVSLQESISRRITTIQLQIKLGDIGRSSFGDYDIDNKIKASDFNSSPKIKDSNSSNGEDKSFANEFNFE